MNQGCIAGRPVCFGFDCRRFLRRSSQSIGSMARSRRDQAVVFSAVCAIKAPDAPEERLTILGGSKVMLLVKGRLLAGSTDPERAKKMSQVEGLTDAELRTPRATAVAGVAFSLLTLTSFGLLWGAIPADPQASGGWLAANTAEVAVALN